MNTSALLPYLLACLVCIATPGADSLGTLSVGLARGRRHGMAFGVGVGLGCLTHTLWAALGVAAVVATSATLFSIVKLAGAAWLLWLGVQCLRDRGGVRLDAPAHAAVLPVRRLVWQGFLSNALNPKVMLFFIAFLPQFTDTAPGALPVGVQMLLLGTGFALCTAVCYTALGAGAGRAGAWLARRPGFATAMNRVTGVVFVLLALRLALAERR